MSNLESIRPNLGLQDIATTKDVRRLNNDLSRTAINQIARTARVQAEAAVTTAKVNAVVQNGAIAMAGEAFLFDLADKLGGSDPIRHDRMMRRVDVTALCLDCIMMISGQIIEDM